MKTNQIWTAPTFRPLTAAEWEDLLGAEGLGNPEKDLTEYVQLRDTDGVRIPAQPVREGGVFWRERSAIYKETQQRKKVVPKAHVCNCCGKSFVGTKRAQFCSETCGTRMRVRRLRARRVTGNLPLLSEETNQ